MTQAPSPRLHMLIDRLGRVLASEDWSDGLNPAQRSALDFLAQANRFSRSPSHLADYMCTTRGTASQTLKALAGKGLVERDASSSDKRSVTYRLTASGAETAATRGHMLQHLGPQAGLDQAALEHGLTSLLRAQLAAHRFKSFGICKTCAHHRQDQGTRYCRLLNLALHEHESSQICAEHAPA